MGASDLELHGGLRGLTEMPTPSGLVTRLSV